MAMAALRSGFRAFKGQVKVALGAETKMGLLNDLEAKVTVISNLRLHDPKNLEMERSVQAVDALMVIIQEKINNSQASAEEKRETLDRIGQLIDKIQTIDNEVNFQNNLSFSKIEENFPQNLIENLRQLQIDENTPITEEDDEDVVGFSPGECFSVYSGPVESERSETLFQRGVHALAFCAEEVVRKTLSLGEPALNEQSDGVRAFVNGEL